MAALVATVVALGCGTRMNPAAVGLTCDHATHLCVGTIAITSPGPMTYTNKPILIQLAVTPDDHPPEGIQILKNGAMLAPVGPPSFSFAWDTTKEAEGQYQIGAAVTVAGHLLTAPTVTVVVDRTPPTITARTPVANATNVALSDPIEIAFSETLDPATVPGTAVTLAPNGGTLGATSMLAADGKTIAVTPGDHSALTFPATISEHPASTIADLAGNQIGSLPTWSWTAPLWVQLPSLPGDDAGLAIDPSGRAVIAVTYQTPTKTTLTVARYATGAVWDLGLGSPSANSVTTARVAVDGTGTPVVAWSEDHVYVARWNGSSWDKLAGSPDSAASTINVSSVVLDATGAPFVGWAESVGLGLTGRVGKWSGTGWEVVGGPDATGPGIALVGLDGGGGPFALFTGTFGAPQPVLEHFVSGSWITIDTSTQVGMFPTMALDSQYRPVIVTQVTEANAQTIHVRSLQSDGTWKDLAPGLATGQTQTLSNVTQVVLDPAGQPVVLWGQPDVSGVSLHVARYTGTSWDTSYGVLSALPDAGTDARGGVIALDSLGMPTVVWPEYQSSNGSTSIYLWKSNH